MRALDLLRPYALQIGVLIVLWMAFTATTPMFGGRGTLYAVLQSFALLGLVSAGLAVTFICGEFDLSVASMAVLAAVVAVNTAGLGLIPALLLGTLVGAALGALQGGMIARLVINSLVFTIGSQIAIRGLAYVLSGNGPSSLNDLAVSDPLLLTWGPLSIDTIVAFVVFGLVGIFLAFSRTGRELYAVGGGRKEAIAAGVSIRRVTITAFTICGACAALAGAMAATKSGGISPDSYANLILTAPAAILVGGFRLEGGRGNIINVILGVAILSVLTVGLGGRGVPAYVVDLFVGSLLLVVVVGEFAIARWGSRIRPHRSFATQES